MAANQDRMSELAGVLVREARLTRQLSLLWFLDTVAFAEEVECGLLLSETHAAPDDPGPALALWFLSFRPVQPMEVVQAPTWLSPGCWERPLVSSASGSAAEKHARGSPLLSHRAAAGTSLASGLPQCGAGAQTQPHPALAGKHRWPLLLPPSGLVRVMSFSDSPKLVRVLLERKVGLARLL